MKKVLIGITSLYGGGAERVAALWGNYLKSCGYNVAFLVYGRCENEYHLDGDIPVMTVAATYEEYKRMNYFKRLKCMRKAIKDFKPDTVINFLPRMQIWMMFASLFIKTERIETVRNNPWIVCSASKIEKMLWNLCFIRAKKIIIQTKEQALYFSKRNKKKCVVISNPVAGEYETVYKTGYSENIERFVAVGRITEQKNFKMMFKAFFKAYQENTSLRLDIYGKGNPEYTAKLKEYINSLGMSDIITLKGRVNDIPNRLVLYDAFLMTSDFEGMPNALLEGMAAGLPAISTDCKTGPKDIIRNGTDGFLIPVGDVEECKKAILRLSAFDKIKAEKMGRQARERVLDICGDKNKKILEKTIAF